MSKDSYDVMECIGQGSFGIVRKVRRKTDKVLLCWKEINFGKMSEKEKGMLVSEVNIIRELRNPFIVRYHDRILDKPTTSLYIVMEYCPGGDLAGVIKRARRDRAYLDESFVWKVMAQSVLALKECHRRVENGVKKPVLHRDLKPANILLDADKNVKIADFGLAKELSSKSQLAQTNLGTPYYMAPEIINEKDYDEKADIWSLGCLVYELCALKPPFDAGNAVTLAVKINKGAFTRIPTKYSNELYAVIQRMIQLDPRKRPRVEDLETMRGMEVAIRAATAIVTQHQTGVAARHRERDLTKREEKVVAKEKELVAWEAQLKEKEKKLAQYEADLKLRREKHERDARTQRRQSFGTMHGGGMEVDDGDSNGVPPHLRNVDAPAAPTASEEQNAPQHQHGLAAPTFFKPRIVTKVATKPSVPTVSIYIDDACAAKDGSGEGYHNNNVNAAADAPANGLQRAKAILGRGSLPINQQQPASVFHKMEGNHNNGKRGEDQEQHRYIPSGFNNKENVMPAGVQKNVFAQPQHAPLGKENAQAMANLQNRQQQLGSSPWKKRRQVQPPPPPRPGPLVVKTTLTMNNKDNL